MLNPEIIAKISNKTELVSFLNSENNSYSNFILDKMNKSSSQPQVSGPRPKHHIIPSHRGGSDASWNLVTLTLSEHAEAHKLLYDNYGFQEDLAAHYMIIGNLEKGFELIRDMACKTMKERNVSFYNSEVQRELGSRPKKQRKPYARNLYILHALGKGFSMQHVASKEIIEIRACSCSSLVEVMNVFMQHPLNAERLPEWIAYKNKEGYYGITALTKTLTGYVGKETTSLGEKSKNAGKAIYTFMGWRVLGINIVD